MMTHEQAMAKMRTDIKRKREKTVLAMFQGQDDAAVLSSLHVCSRTATDSRVKAAQRCLDLRGATVINGYLIRATQEQWEVVKCDFRSAEIVHTGDLASVKTWASNARDGALI